MWAAIGRTAETFDNTFGLPFRDFPGMPAQLQGTDEEAQCAKVAKAWGIGYCSFFQNFLMDLSREQAGGSFLDQMLFFQKYYEMGFLANKIGSDLLMRIVLEALQLTAPAGLQDDVGIKLTFTDEASGDPNVNTEYQFGPRGSARCAQVAQHSTGRHQSLKEMV